MLKLSPGKIGSEGCKTGLLPNIFLNNPMLKYTKYGGNLERVHGQWAGVRSTVLDFNIPGLRYSSFAMALGYGLGRVLIPGMIIYFSHCLIRLLRIGK